MSQILIRKTQKGTTINLMQVQELTYDGLIILNSEIIEQELEKVFQSAKNIVLADGGANRLYRSKWKESEKIRVIVGDLDSVEEEVKQYYQERGVEISHIHDQDYNDFHKAVHWCWDKNYQSVITFGAFGGRIDQTFASLSVATNWFHCHPKMDIILMGQESVMILIKPELQYSITVPKWSETTGCGMIPFGKVERLQTKGFKWNLGQKQPVSSLEWGWFISTSNQFTAPEVQILASNELFFTFRIHHT